MPRHPRTIYRPVYVTHSLVDSQAPKVADFTSLAAVSADLLEGQVLKHLETTCTMGLKSTNDDNSSVLSGFTGFFKWPEDASAPTIATIDIENRTKIFGRRNYALSGITPRLNNIKIKSVRLTLGEELWYFIAKMAESSADVVLHASVIHNFWSTQA